MGEDRDEAEDGNRRNLIDCDDVMVWFFYKLK